MSDAIRGGAARSFGQAIRAGDIVPPEVVKALLTIDEGEEALTRWVASQLGPLASLPRRTCLTVWAGCGKVSVRRDPSVKEKLL